MFSIKDQKVVRRSRMHSLEDAATLLNGAEYSMTLLRRAHENAFKVHEDYINELKLQVRRLQARVDALEARAKVDA
jgi:hypothetical protein